MKIVPMIKCRDMDQSIAFYTSILGFDHAGTWPESGSPSFSVLISAGAELHLSTHSGDGAFGTVISIMVEDIHLIYEQLISRGLNTDAKSESPVHQNPILQTWGNWEFYVDDPNGNTVRFVQRA